MREVVSRQSCDRCSCVMAEEIMEDGGEESAVRVSIEGLLLERISGVDPEAPITFVDLCEKCEDRVVSLVEAITKSGKGRATRKKNTGAETTEETSAPAA